MMMDSLTQRKEPKKAQTAALEGVPAIVQLIWLLLFVLVLFELLRPQLWLLLNFMARG